MKREVHPFPTMLPSHRDQLEVARLMNEVARRDREAKAAYEARVASRNADKIARDIQRASDRRDENVMPAMVIMLGAAGFAGVVVFIAHTLLTWAVGL